MEKILIVDDSRDNRDLVGMFLKKSGYEIVEASNGEEAVKRTLACMPDLILLDVVMPGRDGFQVCAELKKDARTADVPVIFLSAQSDATDKVRGLEIGGADYITKPFNKGEVLARIRSHLEIRSLTRELIQANNDLVAKQERIEEDLKSAAGIQGSLLPQKLPDLEGIEMAWEFRPSEIIGGDLFNFLQIDESHLGIYMVDVSGHGVPAALVTVSVSQMLHRQSAEISKRKFAAAPYYEILRPRDVLSILDREYPLERFDKFFTMIYIVLDIEHGTLIYSNAGHPPPVLLRAEGGVELLEKGGTIIGMGEKIPFEDEQKTVRNGDKIVLYTDGVTDYENGEEERFGEDRLYSLLRKLKEEPVGTVLGKVMQALSDFAGQAGVCDDVSLFGIGFTKDFT